MTEIFSKVAFKTITLTHFKTLNSPTAVEVCLFVEGLFLVISETGREH
jgi:hypothetical protein